MSEVLPGLPPFGTLHSSHGHTFRQDLSSLADLDSSFPGRLNTNFDWEQSKDFQRGGFFETNPQGAMDVADDLQRRLSASQRPSREQLPPISSILQASHKTILPAWTPYTQRSPSFSAISPRTNQYAITSVSEEPRHQDSSYENRDHSQPTTPFSHPFGRSGRRELPHPFRTHSGCSLSGGGGSSVPFEAQYVANDSNVIEQSSEHRWSPRASEPSGSDCFPPKSQSMLSRKESYLEKRQYQLAAPGPTTDSEPSSIKDSLGPKIWTGTRFLPRFLKQEEVPGEGLCYFYDDGSYCKAVIDGEAVNAHWGVTKAGRPRKRLAIACVTCRSKKIKCDPDYPRCIQCEKFGRHCEFKNAPRGANHESLEKGLPPEETHVANSRRPGPETEEAESDRAKRRKTSYPFGTSDCGSATEIVPRWPKMTDPERITEPSKSELHAVFNKALHPPSTMNQSVF